MPKISDERRAARRKQILEAAWACFQKQGLHATTMDNIIRGAGLSAGGRRGPPTLRSSTGAGPVEAQPATSSTTSESARATLEFIGMTAV